jgi:hypothetical protein
MKLFLQLHKSVAMLYLMSILQVTRAAILRGDRGTANAIRKWSNLAGDMIAASSGFLSPPGAARAYGMLMTAEW